jgi:cytosine/adenosine deaminase-related metal-dependent hydrolase
VAAILEKGEPDPTGAELIDLPRALVHPGFWNCHAHLDLSGLSGCLPPGLPFPGWLDRLRGHRRAAGPGGLESAARAGLAELARGGVTGVVDFSYGGNSERPILESGLRALVLREVIGPHGQKAEEASAGARDWLLARRPDPLVSYGLAPHSVYLATGELIRECRRLSPRVFSIHVAELEAERELVVEGTGELRALLERLALEGLAEPGALQDYGGRGEEPVRGPIEWLDRLGALEGALLVHANFLEPGDAELIRSRRAAVVFCPRSHRYFDRPPHPLPDLLRAGVAAALGTDSSASNFGLSMAEEMREAHRLFPSLKPAELFALACGILLGGRSGIPAAPLEEGRPADLAAAEIPAGTGEADPLLAFIEEGGANLLTMVEGRILFPGHEGAA